MPKISFRGVALLLVIAGFVVVLIVRDPDEAKEPTPISSPTPTATATMNVPNPTLDKAVTAVKLWQLVDVNARNASLQPITTAKYYELIQYADPSNIPTSPPVGSAKSLLDADGTAAVQVNLQDGTELTVTLQDPDLAGDWLVDDIQVGIP